MRSLKTFPTPRISSPQSTPTSKLIALLSPHSRQISKEANHKCTQPSTAHTISIWFSGLQGSKISLKGRTSSISIHTRRKNLSKSSNHTNVKMMCSTNLMKIWMKLKSRSSLWISTLMRYSMRSLGRQRHRLIRFITSLLFIMNPKCKARCNNRNKMREKCRKRKNSC